MDNETSEKEISWADVLRKIYGFLKSMKFCIFLLAVLIGACIYGSLGHQVYDSPWFIGIATLLCINMLLCSITRFPKVLRAFRSQQQKRFSIWGSWLVHLGILLVILGFGIGSRLKEEYEVYGIAGSTQPVGSSGYTLTINSFEVSLREDFTVEQYTAGLTFTNAVGEAVSGRSSVNHPMEAFGYSLYQDSTGWANYVDIYQDGTLIDTDLICVGEYTYPLTSPSLVLLLNKFYPDFAQSDNGSYYTKTPLLNNPVSLYSVYYQNNLVTMNFAEMGSTISLGTYEFVLRDPVAYTLIVINRDPTASFVGIAALLILAGLFMSFYLKPLEEKKYASSDREH